MAERKEQMLVAPTAVATAARMAENLAPTKVAQMVERKAEKLVVLTAERKAARKAVP